MVRRLHPQVVYDDGVHDTTKIDVVETTTPKILHIDYDNVHPLNIKLDPLTSIFHLHQFGI
jgi:hypothetical protein